MLEQVDRGVYRLTDAPVTELHSLAEVAVRVPHATICLLSALQLHELTTEVPHAVWGMIDRHARMPKLEDLRRSGLFGGVCVKQGGRPRARNATARRDALERAASLVFAVR